MLLSLVVLTIQAQRFGCVISSASSTRAENQTLPMPMDFDPQKTYRMPVVLIAFSDVDFTMTDPKSYYHRVLNEKGYNEGVGVGCLADYFRHQSNGRLNLQFDVYGPFKVTQSASGHGSSYYGTDIMQAAAKQLYDTEMTNFSIYDWNGDGKVNQVFFVASGYAGNQVSGYVWPNSQDEHIKLPGDIYPFFCSIATELWKDGTRNGFGTIAHEMCHYLSLGFCHHVLCR